MLNAGSIPAGGTIELVVLSPFGVRLIAEPHFFFV